MNKYIISTCILFFMLFFAGCEKDVQESDLSNSGGEPVPLNIVIGEIGEFEDASIPETRSSEGAQTFVQPLDSTQDTGIDIITTIETVPVRKKVETRAALKDGGKFRIFVYNNSGERVANNQYFIDGTEVHLCMGTELMLIPGVYKFVCYTANNSSGLNDSGTANVFNNMDFATFCFSKSISSTDNTLTISFKRQMSQLELAVSAFGFANNTTTYGSGLIDNLANKGVWYLNKDSYDDIELVVSGAENVTYTNNTQYTVLPVSRILSVTLNDLSIGGTNYGTKKVSVPVTFKRGNSYKITVQFSRDNSVTGAGIRWAPGNLIIDGDNYYFAQDQAAYGSYVKSPIIDDPCRKVIPLNSWRMPTEADFRTLINGGLRFQKTESKGLVLGALLLTSQGWKNTSGDLCEVGKCSSYWTIDRRDGVNIELWGTEQGAMGLGDLSLWDGSSSAIRCVKR